MNALADRVARREAVAGDACVAAVARMTAAVSAWQGVLDALEADLHSQTRRLRRGDAAPDFDLLSTMPLRHGAGGCQRVSRSALRGRPAVLVFLRHFG